jgi:hypothetical protein
MLIKKKEIKLSQICTAGRTEEIIGRWLKGKRQHFIIRWLLDDLIKLHRTVIPSVYFYFLQPPK